MVLYTIDLHFYYLKILGQTLSRRIVIQNFKSSTRKRNDLLKFALSFSFRALQFHFQSDFPQKITTMNKKKMKMLGKWHEEDILQ